MLVDENITSYSEKYYNGYGYYSNSSDVGPGVSGIRINASIVSGYCYGLSAGITFNSDVYGGVISTENFTRTYRRTCDQNNTTFPNLTDRQTIRFEWSEPEDRSAECNGTNESVQESITDCNSSYRCIFTCTNPDTPFPDKADNEAVLFVWDQESDDLSAQCSGYNGTLLTSITQQGILNQTLEYAYNNDLLIDAFTYADQTAHYTYDKSLRLIQSGDYTLTRDSANALVTELTDGTLTQKRAYDKYGEMKKFDDGTIAYRLDRDATHITKKTETITGYTTKEKNNRGKDKDKEPKLKKVKERHTYAYTYDARGRLVRVTKDKKETERYTYDSNGNRASATINNQTTTASYTLDDGLEVYGENTYRYDDDGYLREKVTPDGTTTYTYGTLGELRSVALPDDTQITYLHNALGQRVAKEVNGTVTEKYLWANLTTLLAIYDKEDNLLQRFEYADQRMPISMTMADNQKYYLHYDQVGSLRAVSRVLSPDNTKLEIVKEITYDTFGNILSDSNPDFKVPFGFAGGLYDTDTQLTRFGYRDYDAYTGKWTAKDPIDFAGGDTNLYGYVLGDPVNGFDPMGLFDMNCYAKCIENRRLDLWQYAIPFSAYPKRWLPPFRVPKQNQPLTTPLSVLQHYGIGNGRNLGRLGSRLATPILIADGLYDWYLLIDCANKCKDNTCE